MRPSIISGLALVAVVTTACVSVTPAGTSTASPSAVITSPSATAPSTISPTPTDTPTGEPTETPGAAASPTGTATPIESIAPTDLPTLSPSVAPSLTPSFTPGLTASGSPGLTASGSPGPSGSAGTGFGADTPIFTDDFTDSASELWGTGDLAEGSIAYVAESLQVTFAQADSSLWSWRIASADATPQAWNTMRVAGRVTLSPGAGSMGWGCGSSPGDFVGGVVNNDDEWILFEVIASASSELDRGALPAPIITSPPYEIVVECAGTMTGALRLRMQVDGVEVATFERAEGPSTFDRAAGYASAGVVGFSGTWDDASVFGGSIFGGFPLADDPAADP